jgi:hypothetical protein
MAGQPDDEVDVDVDVDVEIVVEIGTVHPCVRAPHGGHPT